MQKILVVLSVLYGGFCGISYATTVNYNWLVDGTNYAQTTCETGDDLILPTPSPTKYGYHFVGWVESEISGSWSRSGTPTPQNPIEPVFKPFSNTVLRAVGSGNNFVADSYNPETRTITRRIGVKVLDGTEDITLATRDGNRGFYFSLSTRVLGSQIKTLNTHFNITFGYQTHNYGMYDNGLFQEGYTKQDVLNWLSSQYANGTPVTVYYPLATPTEERIQ